jgi:hypothetical protein
MSNHEHFKELSALAAIGQLTREEDRELNKHLLECASCREVHRGYARVIQHQLPLADAIRWRIKSAIPPLSPDSEIRVRFLARARAEGLDFSTQAEEPRRPRSLPPRWLWEWRTALAVATLAVVVLSVAYLRRGFQSVPVPSAKPEDAVVSRLRQENDALFQQLASLRKIIEEQSVSLDQMRQRTGESEESLRGVRNSLENAKQQMAQLSFVLQQTEFERVGLSKLIRDKNAAIADLGKQNEEMARDRGDLLSRRVLLEAQVHDLNESLRQATESLERERQLTAVSNDVRKLMGARNLHIMDVHDVGDSGRAAKAFGRVFYAEGESLIFYAFDLPSGGLTPAKYTFQAWGQREAEPLTVRNLGTFEVDDHEQRRWVLKIDDARLLKGIDSVFVTAESLRTTEAPRGKKLLYAYIGGQANHP